MSSEREEREMDNKARDDADDAVKAQVREALRLDVYLARSREVVDDFLAK